MKIDAIEIGPHDTVMVHHCVGDMPASDVDAYCKKVVEHLGEVFGKGHVAFFPTREGETWDFTVVRRQ